MVLPDNLIAEQFCYLTTTGRVSGEPREIEIWFGADTAAPGTIYMLAGGGEKSNWVRNLAKTPTATVRIGDTTFTATARRARDAAEDAKARRLLLEKYAPTSSNNLDSWGRTALPIAYDLGDAVGANR